MLEKEIKFKSEVKTTKKNINQNLGPNTRR